MTLKETVDKYLTDNFKNIEKLRNLSGFSWNGILKEIEEQESLVGELFTLYENGQYDKSDREYVRSRFTTLRSKAENWSSKILDENKEITKEKTKEDFENLLIKGCSSTTLEGKFKFFSGKEDKEKGTKEFHFTADNIPTEEEIVEHFNIDTTKWKIINIYHKTSFGGKYSITVQTNLLKGADAINYKKEFEDWVVNRNTVIFKNPANKLWETDISNKEKNCTVVINLADLHLSKLVSEAETGDKYNIDIAKSRFLDTLKYLAQKSYQCYGIKKFILSTLGDTLHVDNLKSTTTAGTYVESDTRASKTFQTALDMLADSIEILKQYAPEVEFININGNHCELSEQHLGIALKGYFRNDKQVTIDSSPKPRKYKLIGQNFLAWSHGDCDASKLPLAIATEQPELWGKSTFRLVQLGHLHSTKKRVYQSEDEFNGVIVRHFSSLTSTDFWHSKNNFHGSQKRGTALVFSDVEKGIIGEFYKTV